MEEKNEKDSNISVKETKGSRRQELSSLKLSNPIDYKWPKLTDEIDNQIQLKLQRAFEPYSKYLRKKKPGRSWAKRHNILVEDTPSLTPEEEEEKRNFRQMFCLGISEVIKTLERDELRLVLICKATSPPELKKAVLSLVASNNCPAASISDVFSPVKASFESLSSLTAFGVKKSTTPNVFDGLVDYVRSSAPVIKIPELQKRVKFNPAEPDVNVSVEVGDVKSNTAPESATGSLDETNKSHAVISRPTKAARPSLCTVRGSVKNTTDGISKPIQAFTDISMYDKEKKRVTGLGDDDFINISNTSYVAEIDGDGYDYGSTMSFGIAAPLVNVQSGSRDMGHQRKTAKKRKFKDNSKMFGSKAGNEWGYKELNIKQQKSNPCRVKKKKSKVKKAK